MAQPIKVSLPDLVKYPLPPPPIPARINAHPPPLTINVVELSPQTRAPDNFAKPVYIELPVNFSDTVSEQGLPPAPTILTHPPPQATPFVDTQKIDIENTPSTYPIPVLSDVSPPIPTPAQMTQGAEDLQNQVVLGAYWRIPEPLDKPTTPPFPAHSIPIGPHQFALAVSATTETPADMAFVSILSAFSLALQDKYEVVMNSDWSEPLNIYSLIIARSSDRKSAVYKLCTEPVMKHMDEKNRKNAAAIAKSRREREVLQKRVDGLVTIVAKDPTRQQDLEDAQDDLSNFQEIKKLKLMTDDCTAESLTSLLADNDGRMGIVSSESGIFATLAGRYSSGEPNLDAVLKSYSGERITVNRRNREEEIPRAYLTFLLFAQPQILEKIMQNGDLRGRGLLARFLYSIPESLAGRRTNTEQPIPQHLKDGYENFLKLLLNLPYGNEPTAITISNEAKDLYKKFRDEIEAKLNNEFEEIEDWAGKIHGNVLRISGILHVVENIGAIAVTPISEHTMARAIEIGKYFIEHSKYAFQIMGAESPVKQIAKHILTRIKTMKRKNPGLLEFKSFYEIFRLCRSTVYKINKIEDIEPALDLLQDKGYIKLVPEERHTRILLNPLYFKN